jgi:hypothetical protein
MKLLVIVLTGAAVLTGTASAAAQTTPVLQVVESCRGGENDPGFHARASGLPPGEEFIGGYEAVPTSDPPFSASATFIASPQGTGELGLSFVTRLDRLTIFIVVEGTRIEQTLIRPCQPPLLPTTKDQCKNGGWRNFAGFKTQGDCVSFVATKGKNPPANSP